MIILLDKLIFFKYKSYNIGLGIFHWVQLYNRDCIYYYGCPLKCNKSNSLAHINFFSWIWIHLDWPCLPIKGIWLFWCISQLFNFSVFYLNVTLGWFFSPFHVLFLLLTWPVFFFAPPPPFLILSCNNWNKASCCRGDVLLGHGLLRYLPEMIMGWDWKRRDDCSAQDAPGNVSLYWSQ